MSWASSGVEREAERARVDEDEAVAAVGGVDGQRAEALDLERHAETGGEARQVCDEDALGLAVPAFGADADEAARGFERQLRHRLLHRHEAAVEQHGGDADRVRARHRRGVLGLHDDEGRVGARVLRRHEQVDVAEDAAARLVEDEVAQGLVLGDPAALLPDRLAGRRQDAADDDVADLALGMGGDDVDGPGRAHLRASAPAAARRRSRRGCCGRRPRRRCGRAGSCRPGCGRPPAGGPRSAPS